MRPNGITLADRFWSRVDRSCYCWPWTGGKDKDGYGKTWYEGKVCRAHRLAFFLTHGRWPIPFALHTCDNPTCCRPEHIIEGTSRQNIDDMVAKGRQRAGENHLSTRLLPIQVREIATLYKSGEYTLRTLGVRYGVSHQTIRQIVRGKHWANSEQIPGLAEITAANLSRPGVQNGGAKLSPQDVRTIRTLHTGGMMFRELAARFHVTETTIRDITSGATWKNI